MMMAMVRLKEKVMITVIVGIVGTPLAPVAGL